MVGETVVEYKRGQRKEPVKWLKIILTSLSFPPPRILSANIAEWSK
jgi:hypothetical protein